MEQRYAVKTKNCLICQNLFFKKERYSALQWQRAKYCSVICQRVGRKTGDYRKCLVCTKEFYSKRYDIKHQYCSYVCSRAANKKEEWGYSHLHKWVNIMLGHPTQCENCETTNAKRYEWANLSGQYKKDLSDWARLCKRCHILIDRSGNWKKVVSCV